MILNRSIVILMVACLYVSEMVSYPMSSVEDQTHPAGPKNNLVINELKKEMFRELVNKLLEDNYEALANEDSRRDLTDYLFSKKNLNNISAKRGMKGVALGFGK